VRLRIARKMDTGSWKRKRRDHDKRVWWQVYTDEQLQRAKCRLQKSWLRRSPVVDGMRNVEGTDFFAMNRVESRLIRQRALRRLRARR
jgi:hypothetical protein